MRSEDRNRRHPPGLSLFIETDKKPWRLPVAVPIKQAKGASWLNNIKLSNKGGEERTEPVIEDVELALEKEGILNELSF
jgi:hypothetical protein